MGGIKSKDMADGSHSRGAKRKPVKISRKHFEAHRRTYDLIDEMPEVYGVRRTFGVDCNLHEQIRHSDENANECGGCLPYSFEICQAVAKWLHDRCKIRPAIAIICGSGLGGLADDLQDQKAFDYKDIPSFPTSTVVGHKGKLVFGRLGGKQVVCMQGRFHAYEGYPLMKCAFPVRVMRLLGAKVAIITNAAGGLNPDFKMGDIMILHDHINCPGFSGNNPLKGLNDDKFGPRFPAMNHAYDISLRKLIKATAKDLNYQDFVREGTYVMLGGPCYESPHEARMFQSLGADAVGMSSAHEVIVAVHCGMRVLGLSLITNKVIMEIDSPLQSNHQEVLQTADRRAQELQTLVTSFISRMTVEHSQAVSPRPSLEGALT